MCRFDDGQDIAETSHLKIAECAEHDVLLNKYI